MIRVDHLDHIALTVSDVRRSAEWYQAVLGLERRYEHWDSPVMMCAGNTCLALFADTHQPGRSVAPPGRTGVRHFAFRIDKAMFDHAHTVLRSRGVDFEFEKHGNSAHSLYLRDPDGYLVELITYDA